MKTIKTINIAIAESSVIVRTGLVSILEKITDYDINTTEITSMEGLSHCIKGHNLDIIIVNPSFEGLFNLKNIKLQYPDYSGKYIAILCSVTDMNLIKEYDSYITLYDDEEVIHKKITDMMHLEEEGLEENQETLSDREKEIICCVVKGMTNKEIAEQLYISIHTVITHRRNISKKLQIHSPAGLTIYAIVNKLVELTEVKL